MSVTARQLRDTLTELSLEKSGSNAQAQALLYHDLKQIARRISGRVKPGHTLQTTALLHEAWARLRQSASSDIETRQQFLALAATVMHRVAVDHIRGRTSLKRGGDVIKLQFEDAWKQAADGQPDALILQLHEGLGELKQVAASLAELAELLFFVGLTQAEIADLRGVSESTVRRDWRKARAWLYRYLSNNF